MNDPHVVSLRYLIKTADNVIYSAAPAVTVSDDDYEMTLVDTVLTVKMRSHYPTVGQAQDRVRPFLRAWELSSALEYDPGFLKFEFDDAEIIDRNPIPPGTPGVYTGSAMLVGRSFVIGKGRALMSIYPAPPTRFSVSPVVEFLWTRYQMYLEGKDIITTMGYVCLSMISQEGKGRGKAAHRYKIDRVVLDKLGELTSEVGDETTARKIDPSSTLRPHTAMEKAWIEAAAKKIIRRVAELESDPVAPVAQITLADLPAI